MILLITGSHPRHLYFAEYLSKNFNISAWIIERREVFSPTKKDLEKIDKKYRTLYQKHFNDRAISEENFFNGLDINQSKFNPKKICNNLIFCDKSSLNSPKVYRFLENLDLKVCLSYGCHVLKDEILDILPFNKFNIHGGISPWYRGCITHFWPSYLMEPQMTGMTMHQLTNKLDGGDILHQNSGVLNKGDGIHDLTCRTVKSFISELPHVITKVLDNNFELIPQKSSGKLWVASDWGPQHLELIYNTFENKIVDYCLDNNITEVKKKIIRVI